MDAIQLDWADYWVDMTPRRALFLQKMTAAAQVVRKVYGGRILRRDGAVAIRRRLDEQRRLVGQALGYAAMFEAIAAQTAFPTASVNATATWYVDVMLPAESFPNISQSWRNKPAESILHHWFRR